MRGGGGNGEKKRVHKYVLPPRRVSLSSSHLSLNRGGRLGTTDDFATNFLNFSLFSTALWDLANSRPVHSLMLSSHLFLRLHCLFFLLSLCLARRFWPDLINGRDDHTTAVCVSFNGQEVFVWSDYLLDLGETRQNANFQGNPLLRGMNITKTNK